MLEHGTTTEPVILGPHPGTRKLHHSNDRPSSTNFRIELLLRRRAVGSTPLEAGRKTERMEGGEKVVIDGYISGGEKREMFGYEGSQAVPLVFLVKRG